MITHPLYGEHGQRSATITIDPQQTGRVTLEPGESIEVEDGMVDVLVMRGTRYTLRGIKNTRVAE